MTIKPGEIIGKRLGPEAKDESEHYYVCKACGQAVDMRDLGDVFYHEEPDHEPRQRNA